MIPREQFDAYNRAVSNLSEGAAREVESRIWAWLQTDEGRAASVAECREFAKEVMSGTVQSYDEAASSLAAQWYDRQAADAGLGKLPAALASAVYVPEKTDEVARYQAKKLVKGDLRGFARACGEYASNDVLRSLNETIIENAGRDRKRGVRFARVTTGAENCPFCIMLASRGAVYHTRKTAGEFRHLHRNCDCKVLPGFEDDQMAVLVEGHDPRDELKKWARIQNAEVVATGLYVKGGKNVLDAADAMELKKKKVWAEFKKTDQGAASWRRTVGAFIEELSNSGMVTTEDFVNPEGKELQVVGWLADHGISCEFRNPDAHKETDGNTSDLLIEGETWDIKRVTSKNPNKIASAVFSKETQGPNFIVDLSCSKMSRDSAEAKIASILNDERVNKVMLIKNGTATVFR